MGIIRDDLYWELNKKTYPKHLTKSKQLKQQRNIYEQDWTLVLRICESKINTIHKTKWITSTASNVIVEFWEYQEYLSLHQHLLTKKIKDLKVLIQHDNWTYELHLPKEDTQRILSYLIEGAPPQGFDCQRFVHKIKWLPMNEDNGNYSIITKNWIMKKEWINNLKAGDCICMFNYFSDNDTKYHWVQHFAYYLWNWLFISKLWHKWGICVSNLQEMHNFYWTKEFISLIPNPKYTDNAL